MVVRLGEHERYARDRNAFSVYLFLMEISARGGLFGCGGLGQRCRPVGTDPACLQLFRQVAPGLRSGPSDDQRHESVPVRRPIVAGIERTGGCPIGPAHHVNERLPVSLVRRSNNDPAIKAWEIAVGAWEFSTSRFHFSSVL